MQAVPEVSSTAAFRFWAFLTSCYWLALVAAMHVPMEQRPHEDRLIPIDKVIHVGSYAVLTVLLGFTADAGARSSRSARWRPMKTRAIAIFAVCLLYGCLDELTQPLTGRSCDPWDLAADVCGVVLGLSFIAVGELNTPRDDD